MVEVGIPDNLIKLEMNKKTREDAEERFDSDN